MYFLKLPFTPYHNCSKRLLVLKIHKCFDLKSNLILRGSLIYLQDRVLPHFFFILKPFERFYQILTLVPILPNYLFLIKSIRCQYSTSGLNNFRVFYPNRSHFLYLQWEIHVCNYFIDMYFYLFFILI